MEKYKDFIHLFVAPDFTKIFLTAFAVLALKIVCRYMTKVRFLSISTEVDVKAKRAAHFECLRMGIDLTVLGLLGVFAVCEMALRQVASTKLSDLHSIETGILLLQFTLVALAVLFLTIFDSPEKCFKRGVVIPNFIGWISIMISVGLFYLFTSGHF